MSEPSSTEYHLGRLLVLLRPFAPAGGAWLAGLTKLAKLDFLLRYPAMTDRLLQIIGGSWPLGAEPLEAEELAVESRMIRYKYGPWDDRYYPLLGALVGRGLIEIDGTKSAMRMRLTELGGQAAAELASSEEWSRVALRAELLKQSFNLSGNRLKEMIYENLPDVVDRPHRTVI